MHDAVALLELGPDMMITDNPAGLRLAQELELDDQIIPTCEANRGSFIVRGDRLIPLPAGFELMVPSRLFPFAISPMTIFWNGSRCSSGRSSANFEMSAVKESSLVMPEANRPNLSLAGAAMISSP